MHVHHRGTENTEMAQRILSPLDPALLSCSLFLCGEFASLN